MAVKKVGSKGLGRGLDMLIPDVIQEDSMPNKKEKIDKQSPKEIDINKVEPNREQPRRAFNEDSIQELSDSIKQYGVLQPLIVQLKNDYYEIIAGERRWRASKLAGLKTVPVIVKEYTPKEILEISLIENLQREDLNPIEEALAYLRLIQEFKLKQDEVAERISKSRSAIANSLRLLNLDERVQQMLIDEMITSGHARALLAIEDKNKQYDLANRIFDNKLSVRETEKLVKILLAPQAVEASEKSDLKDTLVYKELEDKIKEIIGTKVVINQMNKNKGTIQIEYYSKEDLERLIELFETIR